MRKLIIAAALIAITTGCAGKRHYGDGLDAELTGRDWIAAQAYAESLAARPRHDRTRRALLRTAEDGFYQGLARAEKLERRGEYLAARAVYDDLDRFVGLMDTYDLRAFEVPDLAARSDAMWDAGVAKAYDQGQEAMARGQWQRAIDRFTWVEHNEPGYRGLQTALDNAWSGFAFEAEDDGQWRTAIKRHKRAHDTARAAEVHEALGEWFVRTDHCRAAVQDYEAAIALEHTRERRLGLDEATECATVSVLVTGIGTPRRHELAGLPTGRILRDAVLAELDPGLSDYVELVDAGSSAAASADYTVRTELVDAGIDRWRDVRGQVGTAEGPEGDQRITWTEVTHEVVAELDGTVRIVEANGRSRSHTFREEVRYETRWAIDLDGATYGVRLPYGLDDLLSADRTPPHERDAAYAVIDAAAVDIADWVGTVVDAEDTPQDPRNLDLPEAVADAG